MRTVLRTLPYGGALIIGLGSVAAGCLDRPITASSPDIKNNFTTTIDQAGIDKVDILFDIDNSASMGDKQAYLIEAIPQMIARLVTPRCIDDVTGQPSGPNADPTTGLCPSASSPEFTAVHDMHIGVVTSSLGTRLGVAWDGTPICDPNALPVKSMSGATTSPHNDDEGHLINRSSPLGSGQALADATIPEGGGFLSWFPALGNSGKEPATPPVALTQIGTTTQPGSLVGDFAEIVGGAGESGCGIESQLESWYRFLVQPDPYAEIVSNAGVATWSGVDTTILQQRHDFLRPDSLVAVIVLSDENDSEIDVRSYQGSGYKFMSETYSPPRATVACETNPNDAACVTCPPSSACEGPGAPPACKDANCQINGGVYTHEQDLRDWGYDLNLRHVHMRQKYALDPQFPLTRYYNGLTSPVVPNRSGEYPDPTGGYVGANNCTNPLFASALPQAADVPDADALSPTEIDGGLCKLPGGSVRTPADVFYAHIGGVPHELLQSKPGDGTCPAGTPAEDCPQKGSLSSSDWVAILGRGPAAYTASSAAPSFDYTGIDPHMIESMTPRNIMANPPASSPPVTTLAAASFDPGGNPAPDPVNGREWTTTAGLHSLGVDRQYACIFQLPAASQHDCAALDANTIEGNSCDCVPGGGWLAGGAPASTGNSLDEVPPLCALESSDGSIHSKVNDYTVQVYAKAYPTIRELMLANMMGTQGIVSSLCPIHPEPPPPGTVDPLYGYLPAVTAIVDRLKGRLGPECVPRLTADATGDVPCLVLVTFPKGVGPGSGEACAGDPSGAYANVDPTVLAEWAKSATSALASEVTCAMNQVPVPAGKSCVGDSSAGWCYVTGAGVSAASTCSQELAYTSTSLIPSGATVSLQCISASGSDGG
jgi:hypothetical protein